MHAVTPDISTLNLNLLLIPIKQSGR